jgi:hypothetical protein
MAFKRVLGLAIAVLCTGCAAMPLTSKPKVYEGVYFYNFENANIQPVGSSEHWCVNQGMDRAELDDGWGTSHVVVEGIAGPKGHYGGLGGCDRVFTLTRLIKVSDMRVTRP